MTIFAVGMDTRNPLIPTPNEAYKAHVQKMDSLCRSAHTALRSEPTRGEPLPYTVRGDWGITLLFVLCFILFSIALRTSKQYLKNRFKTFFSNKKRGNLFDERVQNSMGLILLLGTVCCILFGIGLYSYHIGLLPALIHKVPSFCLLAVYTVSIALSLVLKLLLYGMVNAVFFEREARRRWIEIFYDMIALAGFVLFPVMLIIVYCNISTETSHLVILGVFILVKLALFYKCISNFFSDLRASLHLILYFCALELTPDLLLWRAIEHINSFVLSNY